MGYACLSLSFLLLVSPQLSHLPSPPCPSLPSLPVSEPPQQVYPKRVRAQDPDKEFLANGSGQTVANTLGSLAHIASFHMFLGAIHTRACLAQSSSMAVSPQQFLGLVQVCGLTRLILGKKDETIRDALKGLRQIFHTGVALNKEDEVWAYENGFRMITSYLTTETAPLLRPRVSLDPSARLLRPVRGANPAFPPYKDKDSGSSACAWNVLR